MYRCESWTIKKVECQRIGAFKLCCWRRFLRVLWTARSNQSILEKISPEYSLEGLMLKLLYFGYLMQRADSLEKTLILGKIEGRRRRGKQRMESSTPGVYPNPCPLSWWCHPTISSSVVPLSSCPHYHQRHHNSLIMTLQENTDVIPQTLPTRLE